VKEYYYNATTTRPTTRDVFEDSMVEAKAKAMQGSSRPRPRPQNFGPRGRGQSSRTPIPGLFTARCYAESGYATSSVCPSLSNTTL